MRVRGGGAQTVGEYVDRRQVNPLLRAAAGFFSLSVACALVGTLPSLDGWETVAIAWNSLFTVEADAEAVRSVAFSAAFASAVLMAGALAAAIFAYRRVPWRGEILRRVLHVIVSEDSGFGKHVDRSEPMENVIARVKRRRWSAEVTMELAYFDPALFADPVTLARLGASDSYSDGGKLTIYFGEDGLERSYDKAYKKAGLR